MAGVNVKMGVTGVSDFKRNLGNAQSAVKALNEALKANESQLKLNGNQELYMSNKVQILKDMIEAQTKVVKAADSALQAMKTKGVDPASKEFQTMQANVYKATAKLTDLKVELKDVETNSGGAAENLKSTNDAINSIDKNTAWKNVADGIGKITDTLERGAKAAVSFGKRILSSFKDSAKWADDLKTLSDQTGYSVDELQRMDKVAHIVEADAETIAGAMNRMKKAATTDGGVKAIEETLGLSLNGKNADDLFWEVGDALLNLGDEFDKEAAATKIFGKSWHELLPLFKTGQEAYNKMLEEQTVLTDEQVDKLAKGDDAIKEMENEIQQLKNEFWSENADKITDLLQWLIDNKDSVVTAVEAIAVAFGGLKLAEMGANIMKLVNGFKTLGLLGGGKAASAAAASSAGAAGTATAGGAAMGVGGALAGVLLGYPMLKRIAEEGTDWLNPWSSYYDSKNGKHAQVLDTIGGAGTSDIYERLLHPTEIGVSAGKSFAPEEIEAKQVTVISDDIVHRDRRSQNTFEGGEYYDRSLERMAAVAEQTSANEIQSNSEVTAALGNLQGLPAAMAAAVQAGMASVTIVVNESAVGAIGRKVGKQLGSGLRQMVK